MSNLWKRVAVAAVALPPVMWSFFAGGWWIFAVSLICCTLALHEYGSIVAKDNPAARRLFFVVGVVVLVAGAFIHDATSLLLLIYAALAALALHAVLRPGDLAQTWLRLALFFAGILYIGVGFWSILRVRDLGNAYTTSACGGFTLLAFTATWINDTAAYFSGRAFGKHPLAPQISPKKTWEGFVGGGAGTIAVLLAFKVLFSETFAPISFVDVAIVGIFASILGPVGDLAESMLKRSFDVKDSSTLLPGHGGMLDRIDAVIFIMPWVLGYFTVVKPFLLRVGMAP